MRTGVFTGAGGSEEAMFRRRRTVAVGSSGDSDKDDDDDVHLDALSFAFNLRRREFTLAPDVDTAAAETVPRPARPYADALIHLSNAGGMLQKVHTQT